jgi:hypothetical protein
LLESFGATEATRKQRHGDVFQRGELRQEVVKLPDVAYVAIAELGGLAGVELAEIGVGEPDLARGGAVERGEEMEQGTLAGAALADDGDHLSGGDGEVEVAKENHLAGGVGVRADCARIRGDCRIDFGQADCAQHHLFSRSALHLFKGVLFTVINR